MSSFADTIVKDQKEAIVAEDRKMLKHLEEQNERDRQIEEQRKHKQHDQKHQMREFLNKQIQEKEERRRQDEDVNKK